jgi:hypothetical protein
MAYPVRSRMMKYVRSAYGMFNPQGFLEVYFVIGTSRRFKGFYRINYLFSERALAQLCLKIAGLQYYRHYGSMAGTTGTTSFDSTPTHNHQITSSPVAGYLGGNWVFFDEDLIREIYVEMNSKWPTDLTDVVASLITARALGLLDPSSSAIGTIVPN